MFQFRNVILILFIGNIDGSSYNTDMLIQRISKEEEISTVFLFGSNKDQLEKTIRQTLIPFMVFTSVPKDFDSLMKFNENILLLTVLKDDEDQQWYFNELDKVIRSLTVRRFVVVICGGKKLEISLTWLAEHKFTRIFGIVDNDTFSYLPYADDKLQEVPEHSPLPDAMRDLNGFKIRTSIQKDAPRAFAYRNKNDQRVYAGYAAQVFLGFIRKHNARFTEIPLNTSLDIPRVLNATVSGEIDISMNPYIQMPAIKLSYSLRYVRWTILIPHNEYINPNQYFTRPFSLTVWITIGALAVYISLLDTFLEFILRFRLNPWQSFSRTFCTFLCLSAERRIQKAFRFHAQVLVLAFILSNLYYVHLTSFLTVFIKARQAYTHQDLMDYKIRLLVLDSEVVLIPFASLPPGFKNIVTGVSINELDKQRYPARNKSFAYAVPSDKAEYILSQQINLDQPNFHISEDSMWDVNFGFILPQDSPFMDIIGKHVLRQREMGLTQKWEADAVHQGVEAGILHMLAYKPKTPNALTLRHFSFAWNSLGTGLVGACLIFLFEIFWSRRF